MSHISDLRTRTPDRRVVAAWLVTLIIVSALAFVWTVRETPNVEPTPVILPTGA